MPKAILLILVMVTVAVAVAVGVCGILKAPLHPIDASLAAGIGLAGSIAGLLPIQFRADRTPVGLFQSAWVGSVLHMGVSAVLGIIALLVLKLSTPFVIWLLVMYWITLIGLCVALVKTLRSAGSGSAQQVSLA
jgi:hypothetical protein